MASINTRSTRRNRDAARSVSYSNAAASGGEIRWRGEGRLNLESSRASRTPTRPLGGDPVNLDPAFSVESTSGSFKGWLLEN
ncbi:MAG: hypothetical protein SGARI_007403, partial [Bacillariaceae sp.]